MDSSSTTAPNFLLLSILVVCCSTCTGTLPSQVMNLKQREIPREVIIKTIVHDSFPMTAFPTTSNAPNPQIITVPSTNNPPTNPTTNPVISPPTTMPQAPPLTNPAAPSGGVPVMTPVMPPPAATANNAPTNQGQGGWCVARSGAPETALQAALDYSCGIGGVDCSAIQQGSSCYNPNTLQNHASFAFNTYYQRNPVQTSCDFGGSAAVTNVNPSSGSCIFTTSASSSSPTTMTSPATSSSGATPIGSGTPPSILNGSNPDLGGATSGYGDNPANGSSVSMSSNLQPFIGCIIIAATSIITAGFVLVT